MAAVVRPFLPGERAPTTVRLSWWRSRARLLGIPALALVVAFATATQAVAQEQVVRLSNDPFTNPKSQHRTQVEPDSLSAGSTIVSSVQTGRFFNGGASDIGFATSNNAGRTFVHGFLPGTTAEAPRPNPTYERASDASVAFDARDNVWLISYLLIPPTPLNGNPAFVDLFVSRSTDGGRTWGLPVAIARTGDFLDKNWSVCDNTPSSRFFGNCYTEFDDATLGDLEQMSTSSDGGLTWSAGKATADGAHGLGGQPLVKPNGQVVVPYVGLDSSTFLFTESSFTSVDGGASWSAQTLISEADFRLPNGGIRATIPLPSAEIDRGGRIYVAWSDCRFRAQCASSDIVFSTTDDGITWSPVQRIPVDPVASTVDHFIPGIAVDRNTAGASAHLALGYYFYPISNCTATSCQLDVGFSSSTNGGRTWTSGETVAGPMSLGWLANTSQGVMVGDYISTSIVNGGATAFPFFALASAPVKGVFDEALFTTASEALSIRSGSVAAGSDAVVARTPAPAAAARAGRRAPTAF
jgi:BNR repeat-like domain